MSDIIDEIEIKDEEAATEPVETEEKKLPVEDDTPAVSTEDDASVEEFSEEGDSGSGGIFSKLLKNRQARMDAVGEDDDYDIFDLQEIMDISVDDEVFGESAEISELMESQPDEEASPKAEKAEKKHSFFSKLRKDKGDKKTSEEPSTTVKIQEELQSSEDEEAEVEIEDDYVNPLDEMENFDKETMSALDSINEMLNNAGIERIDGSALDIEDKSAEGIERDIEEKFDEQLDLSGGKTKLAEGKTKLAEGKTKLAKESEVKEKSEDQSDSGEFEDVPSESDEKLPDQILMEDYDAENIEPQIVNELDEEEKLRTKRKGLVEKFHLNAKIDGDVKYVEEKTEGTADVVEDVELQDGEDVFDAVERTAGEKVSLLDALKRRIEKKEYEEHLLTINEVAEQLVKDKKKNFVALVIESVIGVALLVFAIIGATFTEGESSGVLFDHGGRIFVLINLILYAAAVVVARDSFKKAIDRVKGGIIDSRAVWLCLNVVVVFQMLLAICAGLNENGGFVVYALVGLASILGEVFSAKINIESLTQSLAVLRKNELSSIQPIVKKEESAVLGYDLADGGDPTIYYSAPIKLPENIAYLSENTSKEQKVSRLSILIPAAAGLVLAVVICILNRSAMPLVTVWPCMMCLCLPIFRPLVLSLFKAEANKGSIVNGVSVLSYDDCDEVSRANAVVLDAGELLGVNVSDFRKYKGAKMTKTDAAIYTAAVLKESGSMLSSCFDSFVSSSGIDLPETENFEIEENLGFSAWVDGARVTVGTRSCMVWHSIPVPTEEQESAYADGAYVIYTCVEDRIVSTFKATYLPRRNAKNQINALRKSGIVVMLNCAEPSLKEEDVCDLLHCSAAMIKIISSNGRNVIKSNREHLSQPENNGVFSTKKKHNILLAVAEAYNLSQRRNMSKNVSFVFLSLLVAVYFICGILRFTSAFSPITVVLFSAAAAAISFVLGKLADR